MSNPTADPYVPGHGDHRYSVRHYELDLTYKPHGNHLRGHATLEVEAHEDLTEIVLDLRHLNVQRVAVNGRAARHHTKSDRLVVRPNSPLARGQRGSIAVSYAGSPRPVRSRHLGTAGWEELSDGALVASQPHGAPSWFPCNDRASDKATYQVTLSVPQGYTAVANGLLLERRQHSSSTTWVFSQEQPISPYLATVHVGHYDRVPLDGGLFAFVPNGMGARLPSSFRRQGEMLDVFVERYGPYPYSSYGVVVTPDELEIPLESVGFSTFGVNHLTEGWEVERLVAHELSHQWFGNCVTSSSWRDIWLHEGFACYSEWVWAEASGHATIDQLAAHHYAGLVKKDEDLVIGDPGPDLMFNDRVYKRGALTLHALHKELGEDAFHGVVQDWVRHHAHATVNTEDFVRLAESATLKDLSGLFEDWLFSEELPDLP